MFQIKICSTHDELQELAQLAKEIWNSYFPGIISKEQIDYMVDKYQSLPTLTKAVKQDKYKHFSIIDDRKTDIGNGFIMDDYVMELTI